MSDTADLLKRLKKIVREDSRYREEAYFFLMASLARGLGRLPQPRHVTGQELLMWAREEAEDQFGPMAGTVLDYWGVKNSLDFGHIVFNMVREGILSKTETDCLEDFQDPLFLETLFDETSGYKIKEKQI